IAIVRGKRLVGTVMVVRLVGDQIVIEVDNHDKTLAEALQARDVPASNIVLAYRGDPIPA
ncbi:MAG: element excision factor XisI family protein, partial [Chloroflexota bacterium]